jgi:hypothetical protein
MIRGGKNYKKATAKPEWNLNRMEEILDDATKSPPEHVKQPHSHNHAYQPASFAAAKDTKKVW